MSQRDAYEVLQVHPKAHPLVIQAAFRALASLFHPDRDPSGGATRRMAELNEAYALVRTPDRREVYDRGRASQPQPSVTVTPPPGATSSAAAPRANDRLDFGRYQGWTIRDLARQDPEYLRWLSRHSSGIRYRRQIEELLRETSAPAPATSAKGKPKRR